MNNKNQEIIHIKKVDKNQVFKYLLSSYSNAIDFYTGFAARVSTRFNILLTVNIASAGFYADIWMDEKSNSAGAVILPILGLITSIGIYVQSCQDKYIYNRQIERINRIKSELEEFISYESLNTLFAALDETDKGNKDFLYENLVSWRTNWISRSMIPAILSFLMFLLWIFLFIWSLK